MPDTDDSMRSLLLPLEDSNLLLPETIVAEVVDYTTPKGSRDAEQPHWLLGLVPWRGQHLPCVALEALNGLPVADAGSRARTVVLKAVGGRAGMPYVAVRTRSIPRLVNVHRRALEPVEEAEGQGPVVRQAVLAEGEPALIPDLDYIEAQTHRALFDWQPAENPFEQAY
ncbi:chemotaxis protein CheW [Aquisalimonas sp.]|uniref:chemotaxis protein CheW n=1 Tax=Aquisalimonas sp. TaxID=1872621 RepID=UPI0025BBB552|nr:chemotaxis protein CheW [Aquisalimonas sp.]